jgi:hypothetical protein
MEHSCVGRGIVAGAEAGGDAEFGDRLSENADTYQCAKAGGERKRREGSFFR